MKTVLALAAAVSLAAGGAAGVPEQSAPGADILKKLVPDEVRGWKADGQDHVYDAETIFAYIDGSGEVYRAYNMKLLFSRRFTREGQPDIIADAFDMGTPGDAFGVFTHDPDGEDWGVGQDGVYKGGLLSFWRDRYFLSLFAEGETVEAKGALLELGRSIAASVGRDGARPALLGALPPGYAEARRVHFLHSPVILNYHFFVSESNALDLGPSVDVLLARSADKSALLLARYPDARRAAAALEKFWAEKMPRRGRDGLSRSEDGTWTGAVLAGRSLAVVFRSPAAESAHALLERAKTGIEGLGR